MHHQELQLLEVDPPVKLRYSDREQQREQLLVLVEQRPTNRLIQEQSEVINQVRQTLRN